MEPGKKGRPVAISKKIHPTPLKTHHANQKLSSMLMKRVESSLHSKGLNEFRKDFGVAKRTIVVSLFR